MVTTDMVKPDVVAFFDKDSHTFSYIVKDPQSTSCAIIDSVLNFDYASGKVSFIGADEIIDYVVVHQLQVEWLIDTHVHADHLSALPYLQEQLGGQTAIGQQITIVQNTFDTIFNESDDFYRDGSQFDHLFHDGETYQIGSLQCKTLHTPGHTPACFTHVLGDAIFVGDTLFMPDAGTARADFPGGDAGVLFDSIHKIFALPDDYRIFICHDYCPNGRALSYQTSVQKQREQNIHIHQLVSKSAFVELRESRDKTLAMPRLILPSIQVNMCAGNLPKTEKNGLAYLKIPLNAFH
ncbi:MBL fold metallo-hydrolase [Celerinatantimonas yamalensis]|uniref:MBL fold metallo-hydrolase n=1 Tax=Celerinatantimonas yamalensis TaxID=559956 RepID=A0ABW9G8I8_9GAMM